MKIFVCRIRATNPAHQIHRALLIFRRPLRVMLANYLGRVTRDVGAILDGVAGDQDLSRESMSGP
jgi:hypothetical protein